jgi:ribosome-associated protein
MEEDNQLLESIISGIQEKKGKKITTINLKGIPGVICDYFVICEGNSPTQVAALAESIEHIVKKNNQERPNRIQKQQIAERIVIDYGYIIVHFL